MNLETVVPSTELRERLLSKSVPMRLQERGTEGPEVGLYWSAVVHGASDVSYLLSRMGTWSEIPAGMCRAWGSESERAICSWYEFEQHQGELYLEVFDTQEAYSAAMGRLAEAPCAACGEGCPVSVSICPHCGADPGTSVVPCSGCEGTGAVEYSSTPAGARFSPRFTSELVDCPKCAGDREEDAPFMVEREKGLAEIKRLG